MEVTGYKTLYALSKNFGGTQAKWKNYKLGGQPNDDLLDVVECSLEGSIFWYTRGPNNLKLWVALASDTSIEDLIIIANFSSENEDGKIAHLRIDAFNCQSEFNMEHSPNVIEGAFYLRLSQIKSDLQRLMSNELAEKAIEILSEILKSDIEKIWDKFYNDLYDFAIQSKYTRSDVIKMHHELKYDEIELPTVQKKGRRKVDN